MIFLPQLVQKLASVVYSLIRFQVTPDHLLHRSNGSSPDPQKWSDQDRLQGFQIVRRMTHTKPH